MITKLLFIIQVIQLFYIILILFIYIKIIFYLFILKLSFAQIHQYSSIIVVAKEDT